MSLLVMSVDVSDDAGNSVEAPAGSMPRKLPTVTASQKPTHDTVVPAGTSHVGSVVVSAFEPDAAADQVRPLRAYAGEPPVTSLVPVVEYAVCKLPNFAPVATPSSIASSIRFFAVFDQNIRQPLLLPSRFMPRHALLAA